MRRLRTSMILAVGLALTMSTIVSAASPTSVTDGSTAARPSWDTSVALVQLNGDPLSTYVKTRPAHGKKIDFDSNTTKAYRAQLSALRNQFKQWLQANAPKAKITGSWDVALNAVSVQLNGTKLSSLLGAPQVKYAQYSGYYHPTIDDPDLALIHAVQAWNQDGGAEGAGAGVKIAMIDSGIDITHPCFDDTGYAPQTQLGDTSLTNNKVIVAKVFYNKNISRKFTAAAINAHGTHTSGTAACNFETPATVFGVDIPYDISGVAPAALLGNYNIFPGDVDSARSEDILNALEAAYGDGMDVANMSIGGPSAGIKDLVTMAVNDLDAANMVVAVAAGNSGDGSDPGDHPAFAPGHFTIESPGSAASALTAGSFSVGHSVAVIIKQAPDSYLTGGGDFAVPTSDITAPTMEAPVGAAVSLVGDHLDGCGAYPAGSATGKIVLVARGNCTFGEKVGRAEAAGALAVVIVNRDPTLIGMLADELFPTTIPAVQVVHDDGLALYGNVPDAATVTAPLYVNIDDPATAGAAPDKNVQSSFSSQGPTDVDFRVKPDVMAPGENVLSSIPEDQCDHDVDDHCFAFFNGTSMATPHLAGSAAVVKSQHPDWDAWQIRSAIVNTADLGVIKSAVDGTTIVTDVNIMGSGRENLLSAVGAWVALNPVSVSFGAVPSGSGTSLSYLVTITNLKGFTYDYQLAVTAASGSGVTYGTSVSHILLTAGATGTFWVTMTSAKGATFGGHQAWLTVSGTSGPYAHAAVFTLIK